jgi:hypothetical protein
MIFLNASNCIQVNWELIKFLRGLWLNFLHLTIMLKILKWIKVTITDDGKNNSVNLVQFLKEKHFMNADEHVSK